MHENQIAKIAVDKAYHVHNELGPGLLESAYQACLAYELRNAGLNVGQEVGLPVVYKEVELDCGYRMDLWANEKLIIEVKSIDALHDIHMAQILTYLKLADNKLGLLINFNVKKIKDGIKRVINGNLEDY